MKQYGFYVDSSRCSGCKTCQVSCKDNKDLDVGPKLRRVYEYGGGSWVKEGESWHHVKRGELFKIDLQLIQDNQKRHNGELFKIKSAVVGWFLNLF
ncbi:hypothetical protein BBQ64_004063 [Salmonella enterica subsp. enterica serovar Bonariensis]|nr:hypothetical protein [Salmonella enterica subsp. enterica serovar Bonariensis]